MLIPNLPSPLPVQWLKKVGIHDILGTPVEEWDYFHTGIYLDEMIRSGLGGPGGSMTAGHAFGAYHTLQQLSLCQNHPDGRLIVYRHPPHNQVR